MKAVAVNGGAPHQPWDRGDLPCPRVHVVSVQVIDEAILAVRQSFVAAVDVDAAAVMCAAVAVTSQRNSAFSLRH